MLTISVALSTYNGAAYLREQLESILTQTVLPNQIVVGDDGSTDNTTAIVGEYIDDRIDWVILPSEHRGLWRNMDRIIAACTSDVVIVCDQDDRCVASRFERIRNTFADSPQTTLVHTGAVLIDTAGNQFGDLASTQAWSSWEFEKYRRGDAFEVLIRRSLATGATMAFRRELAEGTTPPMFVWDEWLALTAAAAGRVEFLPDRLVEYRQHGKNSTGVHRRSFGERIRLLATDGASRNGRLYERAQTLSDFLADRTIDPRWVKLARGKLRHETLRWRMPRNRVLRGPLVLRAAARGGYARYARGSKDFLLDLIQPIS